MESYGNTLLNNIGKVFILPKANSVASNKLLTEINNLLNRYQSNELDRQAAAESLNDILQRFKRTPTANLRPKERTKVIVDLLNERQLIPKTILDIGAGTGEITRQIKDHYKLSKDNVYLIDNKLPVINDMTPLSYIDNKIPLADGSIDLIIMFVVLHHIPPEERDNIISEVKRILSPDGIFIIREHDSDGSLNFYIFLDLLHIFWYLAFEETPDPMYLLSREEVNQEMNKHGLQAIGYKSYDVYNPQRLYYEIYSKVNRYKFKDNLAKKTLQDYLDVFFEVPASYQNFNRLVPKSLQNSLEAIYPDIINNWLAMVKRLGIIIIMKSFEYTNNNLVSAENIERAIDYYTTK